MVQFVLFLKRSLYLKDFGMQKNIMISGFDLFWSRCMQAFFNRPFVPHLAYITIKVGIQVLFLMVCWVKVSQIIQYTCMCWLPRLFSVTLFSYCHVRNDNVFRSVFVGFIQDSCLGTGHKTICETFNSCFEDLL